MRVTVAVTGASGVIYGARLVEVLGASGVSLDTIYTEAALKVADHEYPDGREGLLRVLREYSSHVYSEDDFSSPLASSSNTADAMVIAPCSMKTLASIAYGISSNLVVRAADAVLRLGRRLILVPRETPLSMPDIGSMLAASMAGAIILPAMPGFYHKPRRIEDMVDFIVGKILDVLGVKHNLYVRWRST